MSSQRRQNSNNRLAAGRGRSRSSGTNRHLPGCTCAGCSLGHTVESACQLTEGILSIPGAFLSGFANAFSAPQRPRQSVVRRSAPSLSHSRREIRQDQMGERVMKALGVYDTGSTKLPKKPNPSKAAKKTSTAKSKKQKEPVSSDDSSSEEDDPPPRKAKKVVRSTQKPAGKVTTKAGVTKPQASSKKSKAPPSSESSDEVVEAPPNRKASGKAAAKPSVAKPKKTKPQVLHDGDDEDEEEDSIPAKAAKGTASTSRRPAKPAAKTTVSQSRATSKKPAPPESSDDEDEAPVPPKSRKGASSTPRVPPKAAEEADAPKPRAAPKKSKPAAPADTIKASTTKKTTKDATQVPPVARKAVNNEGSSKSRTESKQPKPLVSKDDKGKAPVRTKTTKDGPPADGRPSKPTTKTPGSKPRTVPEKLELSESSDEEAPAPPKSTKGATPASRALPKGKAEPDAAKPRASPKQSKPHASGGDVEVPTTKKSTKATPPVHRAARKPEDADTPKSSPAPPSRSATPKAADGKRVAGRVSGKTAEGSRVAPPPVLPSPSSPSPTPSTQTGSPLLSPATDSEWTDEEDEDDDEEEDENEDEEDDEDGDDEDEDDDDFQQVPAMSKKVGWPTNAPKRKFTGGQVPRNPFPRSIPAPRQQDRPLPISSIPEDSDGWESSSSPPSPSTLSSPPPMFGDEPELLETLVLPPPETEIESPSPSSIPEVPSGLPFLELETGFEKPKFSKVKKQTINTHTESIEQVLPTEDDDIPPEASTILQDVQKINERVLALKKQISSSFALQDLNNEVGSVRKDLEGILARISGKHPDPELISPDDLKVVLNKSLSMLAVLARTLFMLPEGDDSRSFYDLSKQCLVLANNFLNLGEHPARPVIASHLGTLYLLRFQFYGEETHVSAAIDFHLQSVKYIPDDHPKRAMFLGWLGRSYLARFESSQNPEDLREGIERNSKAWEDIQSKPGKSTAEERKHILEGKGRAFQCLIEHIGGLNDMSLLNSGIAEWRTILLNVFKHYGAEEKTKATCLRTLGFLYLTRFDQLGGQKPDDLEKSLAFLASSVALLPKQHSDLRSTLCILALSLAERFNGSKSNSRDASKDRDDALALDFLKEARKLTPKDHSFHSHLFASYGDIYLSLSRRGTEADQTSHLKHAIENYNSALKLCQAGSRLWAKSRRGLGLCRLQKYNDLGKQMSDRAKDELKLALREFICIALAPKGHLFDRFTAATNWATIAASHPAFRKQALYGYETAIGLLPLLACFGAVPSQRQKATEKSGKLATEAAAFAVGEKDYELALVLLEQGRSVKWNHMLQLQTSLEDLKSIQGGQQLVNELKEVLKDLQLGENALSPNSTEQSTHGLSLHDRYQKVLNEIRQLPGWHNFMRPKRVRDLLEAARIDPVVMINIHESRCDALVVLPHEPNSQTPRIKHIPLPELSLNCVTGMQENIGKFLADIRGTRKVGLTPGTKADKKRRTVGLTKKLETQLKNLWDWVVGPILENLGYVCEPHPPQLPHITWCATGPLSFLPLHAAGDYGKSGKKAFEYVVSSYTPTLSALLPNSVHDAPLKPSCNILLVSPETGTPGSSSLPQAKKELENIAKRFKGSISAWKRVDDEDNVQQPAGAMSCPTAQNDSTSSPVQPDSETSLDFGNISDNESSEPTRKSPNKKPSMSSSAPEDHKHQGPVFRGTRLVGLEAEPNRVYEEMQKHDLVHLACHAVQNNADPTMCGLYLAGGKLLSLRQIAKMRYKKRGLAFLSACQTAKGDQNLPDEAVHLASGMLMTGYSSVIATMWPIRDVDAPFVTDIVYKCLSTEYGMDCGKSAMAIHRAVDSMRRGGVHIAYWIPFVHFGA